MVRHKRNATENGTPTTYGAPARGIQVSFNAVTRPRLSRVLELRRQLRREGQLCMPGFLEPGVCRQLAGSKRIPLPCGHWAFKVFGWGTTDDAIHYLLNGLIVLQPYPCCWENRFIDAMGSSLMNLSRIALESILLPGIVLRPSQSIRRHLLRRHQLRPLVADRSLSDRLGRI